MPLTLAGSPLQACDSRFDAPSGFVRRNSQRADDGISQVELASQQGPTRLIPTHTKCGKQCGSAFFRKPTLSCKNNTIKRLTGAQKRTRTSTPLRAPAPEAGASTNSAIWAPETRGVALAPGRSGPIAGRCPACQRRIGLVTGLPWRPPASRSRNCCPLSVEPSCTGMRRYAMARTSHHRRLQRE